MSTIIMEKFATPVVPPPREECNGYVVNCFIMGKPDEQGALFASRGDGSITCYLDGYAVVPRDKYEADIAELNEWRSTKKV